MTLTFGGNLFLVVLLVPLILLVAFAGLPRWLFRSWGKHDLWKLRDEVVDDVLLDGLPAHHDAVQELIARLEWAIEESKSFDLLHVIVWQRARRKIPPATFKKYAKVPGCDGLTEAQAKRVCEYRKCYDSIAVKTIFTSSWAGWSVVAWVATPVVCRALWRRVSKEGFAHWNPVASWWNVTSRIAEETPLGRSAQDFVDTKGPDTGITGPALA